MRFWRAPGAKRTDALPGGWVALGHVGPRHSVAARPGKYGPPL